jgi:hypothetical protein
MNFDNFILSKTAARDLYIETLHDPQVSDTFDHFMLSTKDQVIKELALPNFIFSLTTGFGPGEATGTDISTAIEYIYQIWAIHLNDAGDLIDFANERYGQIWKCLSDFSPYLPNKEFS